MSAVVMHERDAEIVEGDARLWLLVDGGHADGALGANRIRMGVGVDGAAPHYHTLSHETFYVLDGAAELLLVDEIVTVGKGGYVVVPPGCRHAFAAAPGTHADLLVTLAPGVDRFGYFRILPRIMRGELSAEAIDAIHDRYDVHFVASEPWAARAEAGAAPTIGA